MSAEEQFAHAYANWPDADEEAETEAPEVCACLRTKTAFGSLAGAPHRWQHGKSSTAVYWCLATMANCGPDENVAHPQHCRGSRSCYRAD
jgi:hypothetical protein